MKNLALLAAGVAGALMFDRNDSRYQQLGALLISGAVFGLVSSKEAP